MPPPAPRGPGPCFKARSHAALCLGRLGRRCRRLAVAFVGLQLLPGDGTAACLWQVPLGVLRQWLGWWQPVLC